MKDKLLEVSALMYEVNENTDHDIIAILMNRSLKLTVYLKGFRKVKEPVHMSARLDDCYVRKDGVDRSMNDIITYLENLLKEGEEKCQRN